MKDAVRSHRRPRGDLVFVLQVIREQAGLALQPGVEGEGERIPAAPGPRTERQAGGLEEEGRLAGRGIVFSYCSNTRT